MDIAAAIYILGKRDLKPTIIEYFYREYNSCVYFTLLQKLIVTKVILPVFSLKRDKNDVFGASMTSQWSKKFKNFIFVI